MTPRHLLAEHARHRAARTRPASEPAPLFTDTPEPERPSWMGLAIPEAAEPVLPFNRKAWG